MKILVISDLHLCDNRNEGVSDLDRLEKLAKFINDSNIGAVLNLGDTISRKPLLLERYDSLRDAFTEVYLKWRSQFTIPFAECAIPREFDFFSEIMGTDPDSFLDLPPDGAIITLHPEGGRHFLDHQLKFIYDILDRCKNRTIVIGTHVPIPGSCSRTPIPGLFMELAPELQERLINFPGKVIWCGGHFHWEPEPPGVTGSLTALYASRFRIENRNDTTYTSTIDTETGMITTNHLDF